MIKPKTAGSKKQPHKKQQHTRHKTSAPGQKSCSAKAEEAKTARDQRGSKPPLFGAPRAREAKTAPAQQPRGRHHYLDEYNKKHERIKQAHSTDANGETSTTKTMTQRCSDSNHILSGETAPSWKLEIDTAAKLRRGKFGPPSRDHSVTQEACMETVLLHILKSEYLDETSTQALHATNPLVPHLARINKALSNYDFRWLRDTDHEWASQESIPEERQKAMMACLLHYNLDVSLLMRYLGGNHTGAHRDVQATAKILLEHDIDAELVRHYVRVMTVGCPRIMNADISRENALQYWRAGNNPSVKANLDKVKKTVNKEDRNKFVVPLSSWMWRFIPHIFVTPQHLLQKAGKKDRMIYDASYQITKDSISVNMMTEDASKTEMRCDFGRVKLRLYTRIYNLRITHPSTDIALHANDVKSCFRQLKHHPDCMGAFAFIIDKLLLLQCGLTFGSDFSPASWEPVRRVIEALAEKLFSDETLCTKHRKYLDRMKWQRSLGSPKAQFTAATPDDINKGVLDANGQDVNTPQDMFVDDLVYADIFGVVHQRMEQAAAASIEAIFITLGESDLLSRQDPISFDKFEETWVAWFNRLLGVDINTRRLAVRTPAEYVQKTIAILESTWHDRRFAFKIHEAEVMTGRLGYIAESSPWLRFMMSCMHSSIARALKVSQEHLVRTNSDFRTMLREKKKQLREAAHRTQPEGHNGEATPRHGKATQHDTEERHQRFAASKMAKQVHHTQQRFKITKTMRRELKIVTEALSSPWIDMWQPLGHLIKRKPSGTGWSDSSLHAAGGYSLDMKFWWYIEWPEKIKSCTLKFVYTNKDGKLVTINALEYASLIVNYAAATFVLLRVMRSSKDPHPAVLLYADNRTAEAWLVKASKASHGGRALGYIQAAIMINNPVGTNVDHVTSEDNEIADRISRIASEAVLLTEMDKICKDYPSLQSCARFHPSAELTSLIMEALSTKNFTNPLTVSRRVLADPGRITTSSSATR